MIRRYGIATVLLLLLAAVSPFTTAQYPDCGWKCTANDVNVPEVYVDAPETCEVGESLTAGLYVIFDNGTRTNRYAIRFLGDLYVGGT